MPMPKGGRKTRAAVGTQRHKAWQSMRIMRRFTIPDIMRTSGISKDNINRYLPWLVIEGYVAFEGRKGVRGQMGSNGVYRLIKDIPGMPIMPRDMPRDNAPQSPLNLRGGAEGGEV